MKRTIAILTLFLVFGLSGCASKSDLEEVRTLAQQAKTTADQAATTAQEAKALAGEAKMMAGDAQATAQAAKASSEETATKLDRMFQKAMHK